jgi:hypothetical protein
MIRTFVRACTAALLIVSIAMAEDFSHALTPDEFAAAGLNKLTPEELARLNGLVERRRERNVPAKTEERTSLLDRLKVRLTPGTEIEYATVTTRLVGKFRGYKPGDVLKLENGQQWRVVDGSFWAPKRDEDKPRSVTIESGVLGSFFLTIEDGGRPKVRIVGGLK